MKKFLVLLLFALPTALVAQSLTTKQHLMQHIEYLASDMLEGRAAGSAGNDLAAEYLAKNFKEIGLIPYGVNGSPYQYFDVVTGISIGEKNSLAMSVSSQEKKYAVTTDFQPLGFTSNGTATGSIVFAGFGITTTDSSYDDYAHVSVKDKIVLILRGTPDGDSVHSKFEKYAPLRYKTMNARERGARAILFVTPSADDSVDQLLKLRYDNTFNNSGVPVACVIRKVANNWLFQSIQNIDSLYQGIVRSKKPSSFEVPQLTVSLSTEIIETKKRTANVVGLLQARDTSNAEYLVIGAHYDHLGYGGEGSGSLQPDAHAIHHGADDNASGTAALIEIGRLLQERKQSLKRNILFLLFSGEELGTLGSGFYTKNPVLPLSRAVTMINLDMVGRLKDRILTVQGTGTSTHWKEIVTRHNADSAFTLKLVPDGFGPSDHSSFYGKNIPVLFFFTGVHEDYHKPSDVAEKINYDGEEKVVRYAAAVAFEIDTTAGRPDYLATASPAPSSGEGRTYKVTLGIIPDFSEQVEGLKFAGVRDNGPAAKAGLKTGDILIKFGKFTVKNINEYMYALSEHKQGDEVEVTVLRGSEKITVKVLLTKRN